ncbi:HAE1 family hydrophobic/amphiphilic exporter-1 [Keratinibaculum paraultunense]|uniref:HAE1 family hydrophobic/amphiphilic exporter-1 n=1 Tax=Keratinibaculum paraultunense TaxID=1278232 RepID=A0A4R3KV03_9FIRM|nr:efflux RND transporter permease subunit [Keratinibaculum paraultunense]QQY79212.1 efflux RND transporter permease subunit [Keratinibaculum paraultunense]TCS89341.1 HAE1 family hydrophobic/amphiphilic exporter-1 [Keratinibaculum paraultunense]
MLSKFSVKKPYTIVVAVIAVLILGVMSFMNLDTDLLPSIDLPYIVIMTTYPGASPEEVEMIVTKPIEQSVATVNNIKNVSSISKENASVVILEFNSDTNMDSATIEINSMLDLVKPAWNDYNIGSPMLMKLNPEMLPVMISAVDVKDSDIVEISQLVNEEIIPELESINGVASVTGIGLLEEKIEVALDEGKIEEINKKILEAVDSELAQAEEQLTKAQREIEEGKRKLESEESKHMGQLTQGEEQIKSAKQKIASAESKISSGKRELIKTRDELNKGLKEIEEKEKALKAQEEALLSLGDKMREEDKIKLEEIRKNLDIISQKKIETTKGLEQVQAKLIELEKEEENLKSKKAELASKEQDIKTGKIQLTVEMDKARNKLESGEKELNEKLEEFEKAKEEAFKKASLEGALTTDMISKILSAQNFSMPAGYITDEEGTKKLVKVGDKIEDVSEMENLLLFDTGEDVIGKIYLKDVADVYMKDNAEDVYAKVNGNDAVILSIQKQSTFLTSDIANAIRDKMDELTKEHEDVTFTNLMDQGIYIDMVIESVLKNIIYGGILAIVVLILFLRDIRPTFIIAVSIPISIIFAIAMMYFTGVSINVISLAGLALGVGMLVDNSIVVIENIYRLRQEENMGIIEAAIEGAREISGAITISTLTTACVFLPIVFVEGISRQLFVDMGLTIAYSLLASLLVALTLVPTMASGMLKEVNGKERHKFENFKNGYEKLLRGALNHRGIIMIIVAVLFVGSMFGGFSMGTSFIPEMDAPQMGMTVEMPKGVSTNEARDMADAVTEKLLGIEEIETIGAFHSEAMGGIGGQSNGDSISFYLLLDEDKDISNDEVKKKILDATKDLDCTVTVSASGMDISIAGSGIEVMIKGKDMDTLQDIAKDIAKLLKETEGIVEVDDGIEEDLEEIRIVVDKEKSMENGLTVAQVFSHINSIIGKEEVSTTLSTKNKDYPVIVVNKKHEDITKEDLKDLTIKGKKGEEEVEVKLEDIATITEAQGLSSIRRDSQERYITVKGELDVDYNIGLVSSDFEKKLKDYSIPEGYTVELTGEKERIDESLWDLTKMILLAIVLIYLIMVAQFQSLLSPFIILFTIPLAFTGGMLALIITGYEISLIAMLGFLVLSGIVVNNGIVFIDYTNQLRDRGYDKTEALVLAGKTRMRPILMTAITTIFGLSTLSAGVGTGSEMLQPLAIVSIGGLVYATVLTLFVVPIMYHLLNKDDPDGGPVPVEGEN